MRWGYKATYSVCFPSDQGLQRRKGCSNTQGAAQLNGLRASGAHACLIGVWDFSLSLKGREHLPSRVKTAAGPLDPGPVAGVISI